MLTFIPEGPKEGRTERASISAGTYQTEAGRGLVVANYLVIVEVPKGDVAEIEEGGTKVEPQAELPKKYADPRTTDLKIKVTNADRSIVKDFELKD